jgi:hypothetical protein
MNLKFRKSLAIGMLASCFASGCTSASAEQEQEPVDGISALESAHTAYVTNDYEAMGLSIKNVMFSEAGKEAKDNALKLLDKAYEENCDLKFPVDWKLPEQVIRMKVEQGSNLEPDWRWYKLKISGHLREADGIQQLRVLKFPDTVIVDKNASIGDWELDIDPKDPTNIYFELSQKYNKEQVTPGLYLLEITTNDGNTTNGWFLLNDQFSSANPIIHTPAMGERFKGPNPTFHWDDFKSPEYKSCEQRKMGIYVSKLGSAKWDPRWTFSETDPSLTSATVGIHGEGSLEPGKYWFSLFYRESRMFGDLEITRRSGTARRIYVD